MRSYTIVMSGNSSEITSVMYPPIEIDRNKEYHIGLLSLDTYNTIPNIKTGVNDRFSICYEQTCISLTLPQGSYEVTDIQTTMQELITQAYNVFGMDRILGDEIIPSPELELVVNRVTNRVRLLSNWTINFDVPNSCAKILGFEMKRYEEGVRHDSPFRVDINPSLSISVECSLATGSYKNGSPSHDIFQFVPDVPPGYYIAKHPTNIIYHPINTGVIDTISIRLVNSRGELVDFGGEEITVKLHIKQWG